MVTVGAGNAPQLAECLPSISEALDWIPTLYKIKRQEGGLSF